MYLEYLKIRENSIDPSRSNPSDAGMDVFYCPDQPNAMSLGISPGNCRVIPTGLKFGVPHGYMLEVKNRSSVAAKRSLLVGACVVDPGYDGELYINLHNVGNQDQFINAGEKIAQVVLIPVVHFRAAEKKNGSLYEDQIAISKRGSGGFGSTGA
jgi:dUTP pyrophosphatase